MSILNIDKLHHKAKSGYGVDLKAEFIQDETDEDRVILIDSFTKAKIGYKEDLKNFPTSMIMPAETVMEKIKAYQEPKNEKRLGF